MHSPGTSKVFLCGKKTHNLSTLKTFINQKTKKHGYYCILATTPEQYFHYTYRKVFILLNFGHD